MLKNRPGSTPDPNRDRSPLRVLFFEDCSEDIELSLRILRSSGFHVKWDTAVTAKEIIDRVRAAPYDVILSDYRMPCVTGMDVFELLQSERIDTPFILVTGSLGDGMAVECLKRGVADYVLKDRLARLRGPAAGGAGAGGRSAPGLRGRLSFPHSKRSLWHLAIERRRWTPVGCEYRPGGDAGL
jgi:CheY-like chemotaxis protein